MAQLHIDVIGENTLALPTAKPSILTLPPTRPIPLGPNVKPIGTVEYAQASFLHSGCVVRLPIAPVPSPTGLQLDDLDGLIIVARNASDARSNAAAVSRVSVVETAT